MLVCQSSIFMLINMCSRGITCVVILCVGSALTMFLAISFPFFGGLLGFFGGFAFAPTTYFVSHYIN